MTVIRPNSVSGITSITAQANEINFFRSNGTLAGLQLNGVNFNTTTGVSTFNNLDVGGVLTYQDVTNVDSVGIITARSTIDAQGDVSIADKIIHTGDTNTAIRFPSADTITAETGGTERLRITSAGKVGINSTVPTNMLDVVGTADMLGLYRNDFTGNSGAGLNLNFGRAKADGSLFNAAKITAVGSDNTGTNGQLRFSVLDGGSLDEKLLITSGGTIGINDSSPNTYFKLDVNGHTNIVGDVALPTTNRIYWGNSDTAFIKGEHGGSAYLAFGANNEKMRLTRAGYLGIGTDNPSRKLDLHESSSSGNFISITNDTTGHSAADGAIIGLQDDESLIISNKENNHIEFHTNNQESLRITSDGFIGINESTPKTGLTIGKLGDYSVNDGNTYYMPVGKWSSTWNAANAIQNSTDYWVGFVGGYHKSSSSVNISLAPNRGNVSAQQGMYISGEATGNSSSDFTVGKILGGSQTGQGTSGNVRATKSELFRITSGGQVHIGPNGSAYGKLAVSIPAQSGGAALQVHNTAAGSGDGSLSNIVLRSVNAAGTQWSMAEYRAQYHKFSNQGTEAFRTVASGDYGSVETLTTKNSYGGYGIVAGGANHVFMGDGSGAGLYNDTNNGWYIYGTKGGDTFLYSNGSQTFRSYVTGDYGCVQTTGSKNGWGGLSINGQYNFMAEGGACGIYNDIDNEWMAYFARNDAFILYHNGEGVLTSDSNGPIVTTHNHIKLNVGNWTGEHAGKMQFHNGYMYNQSQNGWIFRDDGTNGNYDVYTINQTGGVTTSDERLKENIKTIPDALNKVSKLKGRSFDFKSSGIKSQGVIAQEVEPILPDIVSTTPVINGEESYKKVNYGALSGVFIEAIKELKAKIETLEQENITLKARVSTLEGS